MTEIDFNGKVRDVPVENEKETFGFMMKETVLRKKLEKSNTSCPGEIVRKLFIYNSKMILGL